jgi:hypothetical protein
VADINCLREHSSIAALHIFCYGALRHDHPVRCPTEILWRGCGPQCPTRMRTYVVYVNALAVRPVRSDDSGTLMRPRWPSRHLRRISSPANFRLRRDGGIVLQRHPDGR